MPSSGQSLSDHPRGLPCSCATSHSRLTLCLASPVAVPRSPRGSQPHRDTKISLVSTCDQPHGTAQRTHRCLPSPPWPERTQSAETLEKIAQQPGRPVCGTISLVARLPCQTSQIFGKQAVISPYAQDRCSGCTHNHCAASRPTISRRVNVSTG